MPDVFPLFLSKIKCRDEKKKEIGSHSFVPPVVQGSDTDVEAYTEPKRSGENTSDENT